MPDPLPITIAGGGLAGLSLGIALRHSGVPVTLHEAGTYPRHRVCGEFISGLKEDVAERLGIADALSDALLHRKTAWFVKDRRILSATLPEPARAISRFRLDLQLQDIFTKLGGTLHENSRVGHTKDEGTVWSAGRPVEKNSPWLGLKAHFQNYPLTDGLEMHAGDGAYLGITPVGDNCVNVCGLFKRRPDTSGRGSALLIEYLQRARLHALARALSDATPDERSFTGISAFVFGKQSYQNDICALGDADRVIPPFTGNGMTMAFQSADAALPFLIDYSYNRTTWWEALTSVHNSLSTLFNARIRHANFLHPFLYTRPGQTTLSVLAKTKLLPFSLLYRSLR